MTPYLAIMRANVLALLRYRSAALAGVATQLFWGFLRIAIFGAFYASLAPGEEAPMRSREVVDYVWLGQAFFALLPLRGDPEVAALIRDGSIAYELTRPVELYSVWFSRSIALRLTPTLLRAPPLLAFAALVPGDELALRAPAGALAFVAFAAALAVALALVSALTALLNVASLMTGGGTGLSQLISTFAWVTSGMVVPLPMFPDWARAILEWLPFSGIIDLPFRLYTGHIPPALAVPALVRGVVWVAILALIGRLALGTATRRLVVMGG